MSTSILSASGLAAGYNGHPIVEDFDLELHSGKVVALLGPNGAGKSTTLMTLAGALKPIGGEIRFGGSVVTDSLSSRANHGLGFVSEERSVFMSLTAGENLRVGRCDIAHALALFPELEPLLDRRAGLLSGGEQQMLTLARALARRPKALLVDELSLGLAPLVVTRLLQAVRDAADQDGIAVFLVEQHIRKAIRVADWVQVMRRGQVVLSGAGDDLRGRVDQIEKSYLASDVAEEA